MDLPRHEDETVVEYFERLRQEKNQRVQKELEAILRGEDDPYVRGPFLIYPNIKKVTYEGRAIPRISSLDFDLVDYLALRPQHLRSYADLGDYLGLDDEDDWVRRLHQRVKIIRRAFGVATRKRIDPIGTVYGEGYYWKAEADGVAI